MQSDRDTFVVRQERKSITVKDFGGEPLFLLLCLQSKLRNDGIFSRGRTSLRRVLSDVGFKHRMINDKRLALHQFVCFNFTTHIYRVYYEQPPIVHQHHKYLRRMRCNRTEGKPVVYLDETCWANVHDGKSRVNCKHYCDNCSRHLEEQPKQKWQKAQLKEWLDKKCKAVCIYCHCFRM